MSNAIPSFSRLQLLKASKWVGLISGTILLVLLAVFQDWVEATHQQYAFYWSESLIFQSGWGLILPVAYWLRRLSLENWTPAQCGLLMALLGSVIHLLFFPVWVNLLSMLSEGHGFPFQSSFKYALSRQPFLLLPAYAFVGFLFARKKAVPPHPEFSEWLALGTTKQKVPVSVDSILYIETARPYLAVYTVQKKWLHAASLRSVLDQLDPNQFRQIHKSTLVNLAAVTSLHSRNNGDYDLLLTNGTTLRLSRQFVATFRKTTPD